MKLKQFLKNLHEPRFSHLHKGPDGKYLESVTGGEPVWNWQPS